MFERPRGTNDWGPEDMAKRRFVESRFVQLAESFGFREVSTPTFESLELFTAKSGPGIVRELYAFKDQGGRDIALRPEFTAPILRFYVSDLRSRPKPIKVYTTGNVYRYEEPQKGRYREFFQLNAEIIGGATLPSDAEVLALAIGTMRAIGLKQVKARIGNIGVLRSFLPFEPADQAVVLHSLDKRNFPMLDAELARLGRKDFAEPLRKVIGLAGGVEILAQAAKLLGGAGKEGLDYLQQLAGLLAAYGVAASDYEFDMGVVRGLDYYTAMVFEIDSPNLGAEKQVGGGGAYSLAEVFGGERVAQTGFALGLDRLVMAADAEGTTEAARALDAYVIPIGEGARTKAIDVLRSLRAAGLGADIDLVGRGPSKNLDYANAIGARYAVLLGERELKSGRATIRDMASGAQREIAIADLVDAVQGRSG
ncbi:MAG TPA: histidine--tRNA ligase [Thermoplasmata archaeon]|nr:histidine--tRNA ligase [Thermoplasmata archaeon]